MGEGHTIPLDRSRWLKTSDLLDRQIIFLDLNFWIGLTEGTTADFRELERVLSEAVTVGQVVCAVSPSLLLEVKKRPASARRTQYCDLMDRLSCGLSLRQWQFVFADEFLCIIEDRKSERQIAYSHFTEALSSGTLIEWSNTPSAAEKDRAMQVIPEILYQMTIRDFVNIEVPEHEEGSISSLRAGLANLAKQEEEWREKFTDSRRDIEKAEFAATIRAVVPQIAELIPELPSQLLEYLASTSEEEKRELLDRCPSFHCNHKLVSALRTNRIRVRENDMWDTEHVVTALPYVDGFACDRGTRHLCSDVLQLDARFNTEVVSSAGKLINWIERA